MHRAAGIDNAATVIIELSEHKTFDVTALAQLAPTYPAAAGRRVGWLLSRFTGRDDLSPLNDTVHNLVDSPPSSTRTRLSEARSILTGC